MTLQFGSSGIRGKYPESVDPAVAQELAIRVTTGLGRNLAVGQDARWSGPVLKSALISAALENGAEVRDYRLLPTPALSYETHYANLDCGVMITASHNPPKYNGFKVFNSFGEAFDEESGLARPSSLGKNKPIARIGKVENFYCEGYEAALARISFEKDWNIVIDPGNGAACNVARRIYTKALSKVTSINSIPESNFSGRGSEPTLESMKLLCSAVKGIRYNAGIGFDGDGDRMYIIDEKGTCHLQDRILAAFISSRSKASKGPFVVPIDVSMAVDEMADKGHAKIVRGPVGDAKLLREMKRVGGSFAGEPSGAWIHPQYNPCPDGILSGLLFLQAVELEGRTISEVVGDVPEYHMMRESVPVTKERTAMPYNSTGREIERVLGPDAKTTTRFGLRVSSDESWVLVRQSGTEPVLRVTVESKAGSEVLRIMRETLRAIHRAMKRGA